MDRREIAMLGFEGAQSLDVTGPLEVFATAERLSPGRYATEIVTPDGEPFASGSGLRVAPDGALDGTRGPIDTLVVAGGPGVGAATRDAALVASIAAAAGRSRRVASVCTGAFLLAEAGLLDGRRAATHWSAADRLAERYPGVEVDPDSIFVRDGIVWTSAGVTRWDRPRARARRGGSRPGDGAGDRALASRLRQTTRQPGAVLDAAGGTARRAAADPGGQELARARPATNLTEEALAGHAQMSVRGLARAFRRRTGVTPGEYRDRFRGALEGAA